MACENTPMIDSVVAVTAGTLHGFTTPAPVYQTPPAVADWRDRMEAHERLRVRTAAYRATKIYPGVVGEVLARELLAWEEFGQRLGSGTVMRLVAHLETTPLPGPAR
jgi:hypothetical protein